MCVSASACARARVHPFCRACARVRKRVCVRARACLRPRLRACARACVRGDLGRYLVSHCVCGLAGFNSIAYPLYVFPAIADVSKDNEKSLRIGMVMAGQGVALTLGPLIGAYTKAVTSAKARPVPAPLPREPALRLAPLSYARAYRRRHLGCWQTVFIANVALGVANLAYVAMFFPETNPPVRAIRIPPC